jgi:outer membrane receptor protein involved in Fe transport
VTSRGVEVDASLSFGAFRLAAGYAFADAEVSAAGPATPLDGLRPAQTPRHNLSLSLTWQGPRGLYASAGLHYVSAQFEDDQNAQRIPGALTMDAAVTIPIRHHLALDIRGENLSDEEVIAGISGAGIIERATPRTLWVGLRWTG